MYVLELGGLRLEKVSFRGTKTEDEKSEIEEIEEIGLNGICSESSMNRTWQAS